MELLSLKRLHNKIYGNTIYCTAITSTENPANFVFEYAEFRLVWFLPNQEVILTANAGTIAGQCVQGRNEFYPLDKWKIGSPFH